MVTSAQVVDANRMATTPYQLNFMVDRKDEKTCEKTLTDEDMIKFRRVSLQAAQQHDRCWGNSLVLALQHFRLCSVGCTNP
jgi:hypothetical protein